MKMRKPWKACSKKVRRSIHVRSLPGMGPILAAVVVTEIDGIERFPSAQKLCGYAGLCPSTHSSGGSKVRSLTELGRH
jgi:transposase